MGKKNRERRAAKAKRRSRNGSAQGQADGGTDAPPRLHERRQQPVSEPERIRWLRHAAVHARSCGEAAIARSLADDLSRCDERTMLQEVGAELRRVVPILWDAGWQPTEIARQGRRSSACAGRLMVTAVLADHAHRAVATLHARWAPRRSTNSLGPIRELTPRPEAIGLSCSLTERR